MSAMQLVRTSLPPGDDPLGRVVLGRYRVVRTLGRGGMGVVYLARTEGAAGFTRPVVIKRLLADKADNEEQTALFVREARILSNLSHPNIVGVLDFGHEPMGYLMVLEYVHGFHLGQWLRYIAKKRGPFPFDFALSITLKVLEALQYAHTLQRNDGTSLNIVHRDISPENLLLDTQGQVRVADFGIAQMTGDANVYHTQGAEFKGKLAFAAPELFEGSPASPQSDVYACGVVLYQLLSGENPFRGKEAGETIKRVLMHEPEPLTARRPDIPLAVDEILRRALAKSPSERHLSAAEMAAQLRVVRRQPDDVTLSSMRAAIQEDFFGEMPARLKIESLQARDAAWREAQSRVSRHSVPLSSSPPHALRDQTTMVDAPAKARAKARRSRRWLALGVGGAIFAVGLTAAAVLHFGSRSPSAERIFVVQQPKGAAATEPPPSSPDSAALPGRPNQGPKPEVNSEAAPKDDEPGAQTAPAPGSGDKPVATAPAKTGPVKPAVAKAADPTELTRRFARQQGQIEGCFRQHADAIDGQPRISVRFRIDTAGQVTAASLSPAALQGTSLGACVLVVARRTQFGPQEKALTFSIPITARRGR